LELLEPVAVTLDIDDLAMMEKPVQVTFPPRTAPVIIRV